MRSLAKERFAVYCDESCHLEHDRSDVMVLGCVWAPRDQIRRLGIALRDIKRRHNAMGEMKWTKVSRSRGEFYKEVVEWFFAEKPLHFRGVVITGKQTLDHKRFNEGSHDTFYYKAYFTLLNKMMSPTDCYEIYLDIKDTRSKFKVAKLHQVLMNNLYDFSGDTVDKIQQVRSHEAELLQVADLLIGAICYKNRDLGDNIAKVAVSDLVSAKVGRPLTTSTPLSWDKFNLFVWQPRRG